MAHRSIRTPILRSVLQALELPAVCESTQLSQKHNDVRAFRGCSIAHGGMTNSSSAATSQHASVLQLRGCGVHGQRRAFAIRRQRRREEPKKPDIPPLPNAVDWDIDSDHVMLVQENSTSVVSLSQAVTMAHSKKLNLVQVAFQQSQPVCRLLDFKEMQRSHREAHEKKHAEESEKEKRLAKMKGVRLGWNIAQHDLDVKIRKIEEFLSKDKLVAVSTTYDHKPNKWQQQYPKAVEVAKTVWTHFKEQAHSWYDFSESGNKQVTVMYSKEAPTTKGRHMLLPWEPGSMLPPFLQALQQDAQQRPGSSAKGNQASNSAGHAKRQ